MATPVISYPDFSQVYSSATPTGAGTDGSPPALGTVYYNGKSTKYKFVKNNHGSALVVGDVVQYDLSSDVVYEVKQPVTAGLHILAGVAMGAIPASGYGWIQIKGQNSSINMEGTTDIAAGDSLKGSNAQSYLVKDQSAGTAPTHANFVIALDDYTTNSAGLVEGWICCEAIS
jgi:hypothetical protein